MEIMRVEGGEILLTITDLQGRSEPLSLYKDLEINEEVNGDFSLSVTSFGLEETKYVYPLIQEESIIEWNGYEFRIKSLNESLNRKIIGAPSTFFDIVDVPKDRIIGGTLTVSQAMTFALEGTGWTFDIRGIIQPKLLDNFGNANSLLLVRNLCSIFECEIKILPNKKILVAAEVGTDDDFQFRYKNNIKTIKKSINTTNLTTSIKGFGADALAVEYHSPNVAIYGKRWAEPIEDDRFTNPELLIDFIKTGINDVPEVSIELEEAVLGDSRGLGDKVWLIYEPMDIEFQTRIISRKFYPGKNGKNSYIIGQKKALVEDLLTETRIIIDENKKQFQSKIEQTNEEIFLQVERLDGDIQEAYGKITVNADKISLVVSEDNKILAETIASEIAITPAAIGIMSRSIDLTGRVTFNSFDPSTQNLLGSMSDTADNAQSKATSALKLIADVTTYNPFTGSTVIDGGKIYTDYLSSISANLGSVTIGILSSTDSKSRLSLQAGNLQVATSDGSTVILNATGVTATNINGKTTFGINSRVAYSAALSTSNYNVYLGCKGEARVVDFDDTDVGRDGLVNSYTYRDLRAATIYSNGKTVATESWVNQNSISKSWVSDNFATQSWVSNNYATENWAYNRFLQIGTMDFGSDSSGRFVQSMAIYNRTYGDIAHLGITSSGTLGRITSATKYKTDIELIKEEEFPKILNLNPKSWFDKNSVETAARQLKMISSTDENGNEKPIQSIKDEPDIPYLQRINGLIAEDVYEAGLETFIIYGPADEQGNREIEGIMYDRLLTLLIPIVKKQQERILKLEEQIRY